MRGEEIRERGRYLQTGRDKGENKETREDKKRVEEWTSEEEKDKNEERIFQRQGSLIDRFLVDCFVCSCAVAHEVCACVGMEGRERRGEEKYFPCESKLSGQQKRPTDMSAINHVIYRACRVATNNFVARGLPPSPPPAFHPSVGPECELRCQLSCGWQEK